MCEVDGAKEGGVEHGMIQQCRRRERLHASRDKLECVCVSMPGFVCWIFWFFNLRILVVSCSNVYVHCGTAAVSPYLRHTVT